MFSSTSGGRLVLPLFPQYQRHYSRIIGRNFPGRYIFDSVSSQYFCGEMPGMPAYIFEIHRLGECPNSASLASST
ncbi:hypothetical protein [Puia sp.]|uniref:hypothetical protein n=1 Tax=Puia sp. TaxID=2045100 RepID=UPI002F413B3C